MKRRRRVLLVEDDALVRMFVMDLLDDLGFEVAECWDATSAFAALTTGGFDVLVADVTLPDRSGPEIAAEARRAHPALPVVFTTGHADFEWKTPVGRGPVAVLAKPFDGAEFAATFQRLLPG